MDIIPHQQSYITIALQNIHKIHVSDVTLFRRNFYARLVPVIQRKLEQRNIHVTNVTIMQSQVYR